MLSHPHLLLGLLVLSAGDVVVSFFLCFDADVLESLRC